MRVLSRFIRDEMGSQLDATICDWNIIAYVGTRLR